MHSAEADRNGVAERPHSPFEALLAVSGNIQTVLPDARGLLGKRSPTQPSMNSAYSQDGDTIERLHDPLAEQSAGQSSAQAENGMAWDQAEGQDNRPEGVGTSGGGESGDTDSNSGLSKEPLAEEYPKEEGSEVHTGGKSASWGARSPRRDRRRQRMVWTPELHERFLNAVNHLGMKNAVPKTILRMMNVEGMTRENVASHLQKYRLHLKRQAGRDAPARQQSLALAAAPHVAQGLPVTSYVQPTPLNPPAATGTPALGLPVCRGLTTFAPVSGSLPIATSYIPPQAWAAGVPGYDALQAIQKLASQPMSRDLPQSSLQQDYAAPPAGLQQGGLTGAGGFPAAELWEAPLLDIAPLSTMPPTSAAAT